MNCPNCGSKLPDGSRFCSFCGTPIENEELTTLIDENAYRQDPFSADNRVPVNGINGGGYDNSAYPNGGRYPSRQPQGGYVVGDGYYDDPRNGYPEEEPPKKKSRKALWVSLIALVLVAAIGAGVFLILNSGKVSEAELREARENYLPPAEAVKFDASLEDPSNENIKFKFDVRKRIISCIYKVKNKEYEQNYDYDDVKRAVTITVDYKKNHIITQTIDYNRVKKPNEIEIINGQPVRLDGQSLYGGNDQQTEPATSAPTQAPTAVPTDAPTEAPTEAPTQAPTEKSGDEEFVTLYKEYLNNTDFPYTEFCLLYLNNDDIPEMLMIEGSKYQRRSDIHTARLCWIENGAVRDSGDTISSMHAYMYYIERGGLLRISGGSGRASGTYIYEFDGSNFSTAIGYAILNTDTGSEYTVNGESVSEERFNEVMEEYPVDTEIPYGANDEEMEMYFFEFTHPA